MKVIELLDVLLQGAPDSLHGELAQDVEKFRAALEPFGKTDVTDFCSLLAGSLKSRKPTSNRNGKQTDQRKVSEIVAQINYAIDHMQSEQVSFSRLDELATSLEGRGFSKNEVLAVAKQFGIGGAKSKKQAVEKIRDMLTDLKATANKSRMYR